MQATDILLAAGAKILGFKHIHKGKCKEFARRRRENFWVLRAYQRISPGEVPVSSNFVKKKVTESGEPSRVLARFSKCDFWNLGEIWDRNT